ncbi:hypothetical protein [Burkholderia ubonensis]|uniref:hypothetical protein n=1 Tax=Burkholderia ubonensis TaxID=101571 RepID=UPI001056D689|nr:hypothetical protein [Burkholderia ubonensis]
MDQLETWRCYVREAVPAGRSPVNANSLVSDVSEASLRADFPPCSIRLPGCLTGDATAARDPAALRCEAAAGKRSSCLHVELTVHVVSIAVSCPDAFQGVSLRPARSVSVLNHAVPPSCIAAFESAAPSANAACGA